MKWQKQIIVPEGDFGREGPSVSHEFFGEGTQHVFFTSTDDDDGHIHEYSGKTFATNHGDLTAESGARPGVGPLASHVVEGEGTQHVFYQASDRHIYELWWRPAEKPHAGDLTGPIGAPLALSDTGALQTGSLASHVVALDGSQHVFYGSDDGHIHELAWSGSSQPVHRDLIMRAKPAPAPLATGPLTSHVVASSGSQRVFYVSAGQVIELSWSGNQDPSWRNLTTQAPGAPPVQVQSALSSHVENVGAGTHHVFYVSPDGRINELWWVGDDTPHREDLTFQSGAPAPTSTGSPTTFLQLATHVVPSEGTQHVFYPTR